MTELEVEGMKKVQYVRVAKRVFRYDFENAILSCVFKASDDLYEDNKEWMEKYGKKLWDIDEKGYVEGCSVGFSRENWKRKEVRNEYLLEWAAELEAESEALIEGAMVEFA